MLTVRLPEATSLAVSMALLRGEVMLRRMAKLSGIITMASVSAMAIISVSTSLRVISATVFLISVLASSILSM